MWAEGIYQIHGPIPTTTPEEFWDSLIRNDFIELARLWNDFIEEDVNNRRPPSPEVPLRPPNVSAEPMFLGFSATQDMWDPLDELLASPPPAQRSRSRSRSPRR